MPSIHSTELLLILVVALLVIGPERLPAAIRTVSLWFGRFRRSFYKVKAEIERELNADEVRRQLHNESVLADIRETKSDVQKAATDARKSVNEIVNSRDFDPGASPATEEQVRAAEAEREAAVTGAGGSAAETTPAEPAGATHASPVQESAGKERTAESVGATHASPVQDSAGKERTAESENVAAGESDK